MKDRLWLCFAAVAIGAVLMTAVRRLPAAAPNPPPAASTADLLAGKVYSATLKAEQIDATYRMVDLVDTQGKPGTYATRGETIVMGGETFMVVYYLPTTGGLTHPKQPQPGSMAQLAFINMHYVQAVLNPHPVVPVPPGTLPDAPQKQPGV